MTQRIIVHPTLIELLAPTPLGTVEPGRQAQGSLFAPSLLPRQLPLFKHGPEEEEIFDRLANRGTRNGETLH